MPTPRAEYEKTLTRTRPRRLAVRNVYSYVFGQICEVRNALEAETLGLSSNIAETNSAAGSSKGQDRDREGGCGLLFQSAGQSHLTLHPVTAIMPPMIVTIRRGAWLKETKPNYVPRSPEYEEESLIAKEHEQRQRQQQQLGDASEVHRSATRNGAWEKRLNPTTAKQSPHNEPTISPATLYPVHSSCILVVSSSQVNKQLAPTGTPSRRRLFSSDVTQAGERASEGQRTTTPSDVLRPPAYDSRRYLFGKTTPQNPWPPKNNRRTTSVRRTSGANKQKTPSR